ncbi:hypothetical protein N7532_005278 [Penicillium argentinense]|uniref:Uncharacterized protein n=1 Tax=Penicillium argentinense TaxID=1131581 RepID=A0A9W9FDP3_9EURO|nr:uncharacterized protein N7532_005278 [Penicillium argentinense]KAJ5098277.1 hypothetical protein N7532_005278 [Penicillium argentinense]
MLLSQRIFSRRVHLNRGICTPRGHQFYFRPTSHSTRAACTPLSSRPYATASDSSRWPFESVPTCLELKSRPLGWEAIQNKVDPYFGQNWKFYPIVLDDRVELTGRMLYLVMLTDDQLEKMNMSGMLPYRERVMKIAHGQQPPNRGSCLEWMLYETLNLIRGMDEALTNDLFQGICTLLQGQTAEDCLSVNTSVHIWNSEKFVARLNLLPEELEQTTALGSTTFRFVGVLNDIYSWEMEWPDYRENKTMGHILSLSFTFSRMKQTDAHVLSELDLSFRQCSEDIRHKNHENLRPEMSNYIESLGYFMSGIESWSKWTPRY